MFENSTPTSSASAAQPQQSGEVRPRVTYEDDDVEEDNESPQKRQKKNPGKGKQKTGPSGRFVVKR